jgi:photosystem II stability/assembly factor-like uncharacterized protein
MKKTGGVCELRLSSGCAFGAGWHSLWTVGDQEILQSDDSGATWQAQSVGQAACCIPSSARRTEGICGRSEIMGQSDVPNP